MECSEIVVNEMTVCLRRCCFVKRQRLIGLNMKKKKKKMIYSTCCRVCMCMYDWKTENSKLLMVFFSFSEWEVFIGSRWMQHWSHTTQYKRTHSHTKAYRVKDIQQTKRERKKTTLHNINNLIRHYVLWATCAPYRLFLINCKLFPSKICASWICNRLSREKKNKFPPILLANKFENCDKLKLQDV